MKFPALRRLTSPAQVYQFFNQAVDQLNQTLIRGLDFSENFRCVNTTLEMTKSKFAEIDITSLGGPASEVTVVATDPVGKKGFTWAKAGGEETVLAALVEWYPVDARTVAVRLWWPGAEDKIRVKLRVMGGS